MREELLEDEGLRINEEARDTTPHSGFVAEIFLGNARFDLLREITREPIAPESHQLLLGKRAWIENFRKFLSEKYDPNEVDRTGEIPDEIIDWLRKAGAFGLKIPQRYGGLEFNQREYREVMEIIGSRCINMAALLSPPNSIGASEPILHYGTEEQRRRILPQLAKGAISAFALTERDAGSDPSRIKSSAVRIYADGVHVGYSLNGDKLYSTCLIKADGVFLADYVVVVARIFDDQKVVGRRTKLGFGLLLVPTNSPGCIAGKRCHFKGHRAIYNGESHYRDVFVPLENLIGGEADGWKIAKAALYKGRLSIPAVCLGGTRQALQLARYWARVRKQWRKPIGEHELVGEELVNIATKTLATGAIVRYCSLLLDKGKDHRLATGFCKIVSTDDMWEAINNLFSIRAGRGYETYYSLKNRGEVAMPVERMMRDAPVSRIYEGKNEPLALDQGREGMAEYVNRDTILANPGPLKAKIAAALWATAKLLKSFLSMIENAFAIFSHEKFIKKETRVLSRHILIAGMWYQIILSRWYKLRFGKSAGGFQDRQIVIKHLVDRAKYLVLMALVLDEAELNKAKPLAKELADYFCREAREKVMHGKQWRLGWILFGRHRKVKELSKRIMVGEAKWLEEGIISALEKEGVKL